jgi:HAD superfamily hydrolase (TIGR01484 family)
MRYLVLACDYDGTLAHHGKVDPGTVAGLDRLLASGRRLLLVTGRQLPDLVEIFPELDRFELVVAENGAVLFDPETGETELAGEPPPPAFTELLARRGVEPLSVGRVIVATWEPHEAAVLEAIRELGLELHVSFNKGAVMVLPAEVNKASGLQLALARMGLSPHNVVGVGDAENDHAFLAHCERAAVVQNALPALKERADIVLAGDHGAGVVELIDGLVESDLAGQGKERNGVHLGTKLDGTELVMPPYGRNFLVTGSSGSGKSETSRVMLERLTHARYQVLVVDPEGDYEGFTSATVIGDAEHAPSAEEVIALLAQPERSVIVNLLALPLSARPKFFASLAPRLASIKASTGRPHWLLVDEAHHVLAPCTICATLSNPPREPSLKELAGATLLVTVDPRVVSLSVLGQIETVIATGDDAMSALSSFARLVGRDTPSAPRDELGRGRAALWALDEPRLEVVRIAHPEGPHRRHRRKYAQGELGPDKSFYFLDAAGARTLRAQNLEEFVKLAERIDDATWLFHLRSGDYARWLREDIKDEALALAVETLQRDQSLPAGASRSLLGRLIAKRYAIAT